MRAVILAGGPGMRLRPITWECPKPMVPVQGRPFVEYLMNCLKDQGITEVILCLHYLADRFLEYFRDGSKLGLKIICVVEKVPLGTAGAIRNVESFLDGTFLVINGDTYVSLDLQEMLRFHKKCKAFGTIALTSVKDPARYGVVSVTRDWRVTGFREKGHAQGGYVNAGAYIFENKILDHIPKNEKVSLERQVLPSILSKRAIYGFLTEGHFIDIGTLEDYDRFQTEVARGILR